jgi:hypothetical protein
VLDARVTYRIEVKALPTARVVEAAAAYRSVLQEQGCRIVSEKRSPAKERVVFVFRSRHRVTPHDLDEVFATRIDPAVKGAVDWEID